MKGNFAPIAIAGLSSEDIQFVRLFIHCEGSIREMERALGVSYPTIKSRLADLDRRLNPPDAAAEKPKAPDGAKLEDVLHALESGEIDFKTALKKLKNSKMQRARHA